MSSTIKIASDDAELESLIRHLERLLVDAGAYLSPRLKVVVEQHQISMESDAEAGEVLLRLPPSSLPVIDDVAFEATDMALGITEYPEDMDAGQREILDAMLAIYNKSHKIAVHRAESPWVALSDDAALLSLLHSARLDAPKLTGFHELAAAGRVEELVARSFIATRSMRRRSGGQPASRVLLPFMDFFNHHAASPPFQLEGDGLAVKASYPVPGSPQCFVQYVRMDALDAYLNYGFADASARFMRSVPLTARLPGIGSLKILGRAGQMRQKALPEGLEGLRHWLPRFQRDADGNTEANQLLIPPPEGADTLANVLGLLIRSMAPAIGRDDLTEAVLLAMQQVLVANRDYYVGLSTQLPAVDAGDPRAGALSQLQLVIDHQLGLLRRWDDSIAARRAAASGVSVPHQPAGTVSWS